MKINCGLYCLTLLVIYILGNAFIETQRTNPIIHVDGKIHAVKNGTISFIVEDGEWFEFGRTID